MKAKTSLLIVLCLLGAVVAGCGAPPPPPVRNVPLNFEGIYNGEHTALFTVTSPAGRAMQPHQQAGPVHVTDENSGVQLSLRLADDMRPCHLRGQRQGGTGRVVIENNQRCHVRMHYQGTLVFADVRFASGYADFNGHLLSVDLNGPFNAEALVGGARESMAGTCRITFRGTREASVR